MKIGGYILRRSINGFIGFIFIVLMFSIILNVQLDHAARANISEAMQWAISPEDTKDKSVEQIEEYRNQVRQSMERSYDLDKPLLLRIVLRTVKALYLDFGPLNGQKDAASIRHVLFHLFPRTLILSVSSTFVCIFIALYLGILKAKYANSLFDRVSSLFTMIFQGVPAWVIGSFAIVYVAGKWGLLPFGSMNSVPPPESPIAFFFDRVLHMVLPVLSVILVKLWGNAFLVRNILLGPLGEDYVIAARGRGLPERKILYGHALRSASPAIVTLSSLTFVASFAGDVALEIVFNWQGIGYRLWTATRQTDVPMMMAILTTYTLFYIISLIILDIVYLYLDPRIKY